MKYVNALLLVLFVNAVVSFFIAFYFQVHVILKMFGYAGLKDVIAHRKTPTASDNPNSEFLKFIMGNTYPELRRKWINAIIYVVISYVAVFATAGYQGHFS